MCWPRINSKLDIALKISKPLRVENYILFSQLNNLDDFSITVEYSFVVTKIAI